MSNDKLAEALRDSTFVAAMLDAICETDGTVDRMSARDAAYRVRNALQAHAAQAQPPATRVTDAMVKAAMRADFCGHNVADALMRGTDWNTEVMRAALEAALAAQGNPNG